MAESDRNKPVSTPREPRESGDSNPALSSEDLSELELSGPIKTGATEVTPRVTEPIVLLPTNPEPLTSERMRASSAETLAMPAVRTTDKLGPTGRLPRIYQTDSKGKSGTGMGKVPAAIEQAQPRPLAEITLPAEMVGTDTVRDAVPLPPVGAESSEAPLMISPGLLPDPGTPALSEDERAFIEELRQGVEAAQPEQPETESQAQTSMLRPLSRFFKRKLDLDVTGFGGDKAQLVETDTRTSAPETVTTKAAVTAVTLVRPTPPATAATGGEAIAARPKDNAQIQVLHLRDVSFDYDGRVVVNRISFDVTAGEAVGIIGRNGSGKSTLLRICAGIVPPTAGVVRVNNIDLHRGSYSAVQAVRRTMGYVFQDGNLLSTLSVFDNIALPLRYHTLLDEDSIERKVRLHLRQLGIENLAGLKPAVVSSNALRRVGIARALVTEPRIVFFDEPFANLDAETAELVSAVIAELKRQGVAVVVASSGNPALIPLLDRWAALENGILVRISATQVANSNTGLAMDTMIGDVASYTMKFSG